MHKEQLPLIIDLDNSLVVSDTLVDSISQCLSKNILNIFLLLVWVASGKAFFKYKIAQNFPIEAKKLSYRKEILDLINDRKKHGKKIYLCSGANEIQVKLIYEYLGIFDGYYGSTKENNLIGNRKKIFLENKFGYKNYDYLGDSSVDVPIWKSSNTAYLVNVNKKLKNQLIRHNINYCEIVPPIKFIFKIKNYIKAIRIYQWVKNLLIFVPIFLAQEFSENHFVNAFIAFICFSIVSSFVYLINDFLDIQNDRSHPRKKDRPIASGAINPFSIIFIFTILLVFSLYIANFILNELFFIILTFYIITNFFYSSYLKKIYLIDVLLLSSFYTLRLISGGVVNEISLSPWLIWFSVFFFLFLALIKRIGEVTNFNVEKVMVHGRSYDEGVIKRTKYLTIITSLISLILLTMYFFSDKALTLYNNIYILFLICPLLTIWKIKIYNSAINNKMYDDPIIFIFKDKISWIVFISISILITSQMKIW